MADAASPDDGAQLARVVERLVAGDRRVLAQSITRVENGGAEAGALIRAAFPHARDTPVIGITGSSGAGKSTLVDALTTALRSQGLTVAILAIDPSSPFSGGALLGDRVRMQKHSEDDGVYVRSMATRGAMGGLAAAVYDTTILLSAAGFDRLLIETVGAGQDEVDIAGVADTTCVVVTPGGGDEVQAIKAGIMEIADIFVLNKSDLDGADRTEAQLQGWVTGQDEGEWVPPVVRTVAPSGGGLDELMIAIAAHESWFRTSDAARVKRRTVSRLRLRAVLRERMLDAARTHGFSDDLEAELIDAITGGELDPHSAADRVLKEVFSA